MVGLYTLYCLPGRTVARPDGVGGQGVVILQLGQGGGEFATRAGVKQLHPATTSESPSPMPWLHQCCLVWSVQRGASKSPPPPPAARVPQQGSRRRG
jgi:hypothetical protein